MYTTCFIRPILITTGISISGDFALTPEYEKEGISRLRPRLPALS